MQRNQAARRRAQLERALHALRTNPHRHTGPTPADEEDLAAAYCPGGDSPHPMVLGRGNRYGRRAVAPVGGAR